MAASSSSSRSHDVFPSFRGEDVRASFVSHLLKELDRKSIITFRDHEIKRGHSIGQVIFSAIREAKISVVIFSKNYASSRWCLDELVEIHKCYNDLGQMVIPVFYNVDPSEVRKQTGEFGKVFDETCEYRQYDHIQKWKQALTDVANLAGEHLKKGCIEANMVEKIANDVSKKLLGTPSNYFDNLVGIEAHIEAMSSILCLESEEVRMVGIVGPAGIGKSTIGRALFRQLNHQFPFRVFGTYKKTSEDDFDMKLSWEQQFLSNILGQKDIEISQLGVVEQRLKHKKVLIVLDDVVELELLTTLVGKTEWFGPGSRIIVITQDRLLLEAHNIALIYEVDFPSDDLALVVFCQSAFGQNSPPDGFMELAVKVAKLAGNLPLGLHVLGSSLRGRGQEEWKEMLPVLQNHLDGDIGKILSVSFDRLNEEGKLLFLYIACLFNGEKFSYIQTVLRDPSVNTGLQMLAKKSLIHITPAKSVMMHDMLKNLGREIVRAESIDPGKRRFLMDVDDIECVLTYNTGTETVLGISLEISDIKEPLLVHKNAFERMSNLQIIYIWYTNDYCWQEGEGRLELPEGLVYLPSKLRVLWWDIFPAKCLPSTFKAEFLFDLQMRDSKLEKLWEGTQPLGNLRVMNMRGSIYLEVIPDLSKAKNLEQLDLSNCISLVTLPFSIQNVTKLWKLDLDGCIKLENIPPLLNLESLKVVSLNKCYQVKNFPKIFVSWWKRQTNITVEECLWSKNLHGAVFLDCLMRYIPSQFRPEHFTHLTVTDSKLEKLWEGVQSLGSLVSMYLSECGNLTEIPDLSKATNLEELILRRCNSLVMVPSTIGNLQKLETLEMTDCTGLEVLPIGVNLSSLEIVDFSGCSKLSIFPKISSSIKKLYLGGTAIEGVPCFINNFSRLSLLKMCGCKRLKNISPNIFRLTSLKIADFSDCGVVITALSDVSTETTTHNNLSPIPLYENTGETSDFQKMCTREKYDSDFEVGISDEYFDFRKCFRLDEDARELILRSCFKTVILPGSEVPTYFKHRASGDCVTVTLPQSFLNQDFLRYKACVMLEPTTVGQYFKLSLNVGLLFNGVFQIHGIFKDMMLVCETDHVVVFVFEFQPIRLPSKLDSNEVEFMFLGEKRIKECGVRLLNVSLSADGSAESSEKEYNQHSGEVRDVIETGGSNKRMRMTSGEYYNLPGGQNVAYTGLTAVNLELSFGQGEASSVSSYPCLESEALCVDNMITEEQDTEISMLDPSPSLCQRYTVFPSFRSEDVGKSFLSHLLKEFNRIGISIFSDNEIERRSIGPELLLAIHEAKILIVIFSRNYASSTWCLDELVEIHKCYREFDLVVIPIFYKVDLWEVRKQTGEFGKVFHKTCEDKPEHQKQKWKQALTDVATLAGQDLKKGKQVLHAEKVVRNACLRLSLKESRNLARILTFLNHSKPSDADFVGLWGMAGIGKTSIAREIFRMLAPQYDISYFLNDFYQIRQKKGLRQMREDFLSEVFREEELSISPGDIKQSFMRDRFHNKTILVVLDDISNARDAEAVVGGFGWFSHGHRIILTSRKKQVLVQCKVKEPFEIQKLCETESSCLCKRYFSDESVVISELMSCSSGIPLALNVLGCSLSKKLDINEMMKHLQSLRINPPIKIQKAFQRSFDDLDENEENIFLDLACFFGGEDKDHVVKLLDACGFRTNLGIYDLIEESLISLLDNKIEIPIPFQDIGRFIVNQENNDPCKRSRLWNSSDIKVVLTNDSGTEAIEGIFLDASDLTCELNPTVFFKMYNLRLLKFYCSTSANKSKLVLPQGLDTFPDELRLLHWEDYPLEYLPPKFNPENLVEVNMPYSNMVKLWEEEKNGGLEKLKIITLSHSRNLIDIAILSGALNLEFIDLEGCTSLVDVSTSIPRCGKLVSLNMKDCSHLRSLPSMIGLTSLKYLNLSGCKELEKIQDFAPNLQRLYLAGTAIRNLPLSIGNLSQLDTLDLENCTELHQLPFESKYWRSIDNLKLSGSGCTSLENLPQN